MSIDEADDSVLSGDLIPIMRSEILVISPLPADFYVKINDQKYIRVGRKGAAKIEDLRALQDPHKIADLYVRRDEYKNCVGKNLQIAELAISNAELSELKKVDCLCLASDSVFSEIEKLGFNHESVEHSKSVANSIVTLVSAKQDLNDVVTMMAGISSELVRHGMAVAAISIIIAKEMGWTQTSTIQKLAFAGLMHDIGLKEVQLELITKPRHQMTAAEVKEYESHVMRGATILNSMPSVSSDIVAVAMEHHENAIGQGYPKHLRDIRMNPFSKIVALADTFYDLAFHSPSNPHGRTAEEAIKYIEVTLGQPFNKPTFQALKETLSLKIRAKKVLRKTASSSHLYIRFTITLDLVYNNERGL